MLDVTKEQMHLAKLAAADPTKRFKKLYRLLCNEELMYAAWRDVARTRGKYTPGIDGLTTRDVDEAFLKSLIKELKEETYEHQPVRRVLIPKPNGKLRPLGLPNIKDRLVQAAIKRVFEPIFEQTFLPCSYGGRPGTGCYPAIQQACRDYSLGATWIIKADITGCYDYLDHALILELLRRRIADDRMINLVNRTLKSGYQLKGKYHPSPVGTQQGSFISQLLVNIALHEFDQHMLSLGANSDDYKYDRETRRNGKFDHLSQIIERLRNALSSPDYSDEKKRKEIQNQLDSVVCQLKKTPEYLSPRRMSYIRYVDDFIILLSRYSKQEAKELQMDAQAFLQSQLKWGLSPEKTSILHRTDKLRFLGFDLKGVKTAEGRPSVKVLLPQEKITKFFNDLQKSIEKPELSQTEKLKIANSKMRGWMGYFRVADKSGKAYRKALHRYFKEIARNMAKKEDCAMRKAIKKYFSRGKGMRCLRIPEESRAMALVSASPGRASLNTFGKLAGDRVQIFKTSARLRARKRELVDKS